MIVGKKAESAIFLFAPSLRASFWFDKCIPNGTSLTEIAGVLEAFMKQNPQYVDSTATNLLLTAMHIKWKCK